MKRVLKTIVVAFAIALALIFIKNEYARCLPASTYGMQAAIRKGSTDNLFIGSSMFRQGLDIDVLEEELPGSTYILSYNGNQPALMAMELQYMLEQGLEIQNLYIDLYPYTAAADPWISDTKILLDTDLKFKAKAWRLISNSTGASFGDFYEFFVTANNEQLLTYPLNNKIVSSQFRDGGSLLRQPGQDPGGALRPGYFRQPGRREPHPGRGLWENRGAGGRIWPESLVPGDAQIRADVRG